MATCSQTLEPIYLSRLRNSYVFKFLISVLELKQHHYELPNCNTPYNNNKHVYKNLKKRFSTMCTKMMVSAPILGSILHYKIWTLQITTSSTTNTYKKKKALLTSHEELVPSKIQQYQNFSLPMLLRFSKREGLQTEMSNYCATPTTCKISLLNQTAVCIRNFLTRHLKTLTHAQLV